LRNLDAINLNIAKPRYSLPAGSFLMVFMGATGIALAQGAAPKVPFMENPIILLCLVLLLLAILLAPLAWLFNWGWKAQQFGSGFFGFSSTAMVAWIPILSVVLYSKVPLWMSLVYVAINLAWTIWWCRRFVLFYRHIYADLELWAKLYVEESDAVYYTQRTDVWLVEKKYKFESFPSGFLFVIAMVAGFIIPLSMPAVMHAIGLPFTHIVLAIGAAPISVAVLGLSTKGVLVFYYYPSKIKSKTGKDVYVDMVTPRTH
jgi:hypothetical protein